MDSTNQLRDEGIFSTIFTSKIKCLHQRPKHELKPTRRSSGAPFAQVELTIDTSRPKEMKSPGPGVETASLPKIGMANNTPAEGGWTPIEEKPINSVTL
jgi:hypothetical protein